MPVRHGLLLRLLWIFLLLVPLSWLMLDPGGRRWVDVTLLRLLGDPVVRLDYATLDGAWSPEGMRHRFPGVGLRCVAATVPQGARVERCHATVAAVNGIPARHLLFTFRDGRLRRLEFAYRAAYHRVLFEHLRRRLGGPRLVEASPGVRVAQWRLGAGWLVMKAQVSAQGDNRLFWRAAP